MTVTSTPANSAHAAHSTPAYTHSHSNSNNSPSKRHHLAFDRQLLAQAAASATKNGGLAAGSPLWALAKHLQLRLQYARLKVDHGWQKQTINEVENLYFHHRHASTSSTQLRAADAMQKSQHSVFINRTATSSGIGTVGPGGLIFVNDQVVGRPNASPSKSPSGLVRIAPAPSASTTSGADAVNGGSESNILQPRVSEEVTNCSPEQNTTSPSRPSPQTPHIPDTYGNNDSSDETDDAQHVPQEDVDMLAVPTGTSTQPNNQNQRASTSQNTSHQSTTSTSGSQPFLTTARAGQAASSTSASTNNLRPPPTLTLPTSSFNNNTTLPASQPNSLRPLTPTSSSNQTLSRTGTPGATPSPAPAAPALSYDSFWSTHARTMPSTGLKR